VGCARWLYGPGGEFRPSAEISEIKYFSVKELPSMLKTEKTLLEKLMKRE